MIVFRLIGRALRRVLALALFLLIRGRRVLVAAVALLVVAWIAVANVNRLPIPAGSLPSFLPVGSASNNAPAQAPRATTKLGTINSQASPSVQNYIKGLTQFDAKLMWGSLSDDAITSMKSRGGSLETLQAGLDDAKKRGARYEDVTQVGAYPLQDGGKYEFYVISRRGFTGPDQLEQVFFVFTLDKTGKITRID
jgi:hypothetical protein